MADSFKTMNKISTAVVQNQFFLYFLFVLAIIYLYKFIATDDMISAGVLLLSGVLTSFFSKNMVIIIGISLLVTYIYCISVKYKEIENAAKEGFKNEESEDESDDEDDDESDDEDDDVEKFKNRKGNSVDEISDSLESEITKEGFAGKNKDTVEIDRAKLFGLAFAAEQCRKQGFGQKKKKK